MVSSTAIDPNWKMIVLAYTVDKFTLQTIETCYFLWASISGRRGHLWLPSGFPGATGTLGLSSGPFRLLETSLQAFKTHSNISLHRRQTGGAYGRPGVFRELRGRSSQPTRNLQKGKFRHAQPANHPDSQPANQVFIKQ